MDTPIQAQALAKARGGASEVFARFCEGIRKVRELFGWSQSAKPAFLRFKAIAGILPPPLSGSAGALLLADLLRKDPGEVSWDEIDAGRIALVPVMPLQLLQADFGALAGEYETVTGSKPFASGTFPNPPTTEAEWRWGVVNLIENIAKFRSARLSFERARSLMGLCFGSLLFLLMVLGFFRVQHLASENQATAPPTTLWQAVLFAGIIGAGFSVLSRLYSLTWSPRITAQVKDQQALKKGLVISYILSLSEGAIAAGVMYLLFTSGLLKGDLFPAFKDATGDFGTAVQRFLACQPNSTGDLAKLLAWAFIAGFSERLVPDKLSRLAGEASDETPKK